MKKRSLLLGGVLISMTSVAADLLECVNPDVTNSILMTSRDAPDFIVTDEVPAYLDGFEAGEQFEWTGSKVTAFDTRSTYKTELDAAEAQLAMNAALERAGFVTWSDGDDSGFVLNSPPMMTTHCRDSRTGVLIVRDVSGSRFLTLSQFAQPSGEPCEEASNRPSVGSRGFEFIPQLELPAIVLISSRPGAIPTGVGNGSNDTFTTMLEVESVGDMGELVQVLDDQIRKQGWTGETSWSGAVSAGSIWNRELEDGTRLAGKLTVQRIGGGYHDLSFMLTAVN